MLSFINFIMVFLPWFSTVPSDGCKQQLCTSSSPYPTVAYDIADPAPLAAICVTDGDRWQTTDNRRHIVPKARSNGRLKNSEWMFHVREREGERERLFAKTEIQCYHTILHTVGGLPKKQLLINAGRCIETISNQWYSIQR